MCGNAIFYFNTLFYDFSDKKIPVLKKKMATNLRPHQRRNVEKFSIPIQKKMTMTKITTLQVKKWPKQHPKRSFQPPQPQRRSIKNKRRRKYRRIPSKVRPKSAPKKSLQQRKMLTKTILSQVRPRSVRQSSPTVRLSKARPQGLATVRRVNKQ